MFRTTLHHDRVIFLVITDQHPNFPIEKGFFRGWIILDEHHLCPNFKFQFFFGWIGVFGENAMNFRIENQWFSLNFRQLRLVDLVGLAVVCGQGDIAFTIFGHKVGDKTRVE